MSAYELAIAFLTAKYVVGAEHNDNDLQQDAADKFCDLIELNETEFTELGLEIEK
jgi:hypothetical protein